MSGAKHVLALTCHLFAVAWAGTADTHVVLARDVASPVELADREERLKKGEVRKLWHQTTEPVCKAILNSRFYNGKGGIAGGGIYFAQEDWHTGYKAQKKGCMIEVWVALGKVKNLTFVGDQQITPAKMLHAGYDAVWIPRGCSGPPCTNAPMPENVVYFSDQILEMSVYRCSPDGKRRIGDYISAGPLSAKPPKFVHSEGVSQNPLKAFLSIGSVAVNRPSEDIAPQKSDCPDVRYWMVLIFIFGLATGALLLSVWQSQCSSSARQPQMRGVSLESDDSSEE
jgi:hypothetical protein